MHTSLSIYKPSFNALYGVKLLCACILGGATQCVNTQAFKIEIKPLRGISTRDVSEWLSLYMPFTILLFAGVAVFSYIYKALDSYGVKTN